MPQSDEEKIIRLKKFAKDAHGTRENTLQTLSAHEKLLEDAQNKADTLSTCITSACSGHFLELQKIITRLNLGNVSDINNLNGFFTNNIINSTQFVVNQHPANKEPGSLYGPFTLCLKPIDEIEEGAFVYDAFNTKVMLLRPDIAGCYCNTRIDPGLEISYGDIQLTQAVQETDLSSHGETLGRVLVNSAAYETRLSAWSIHAPLTGRPLLIKHPASEKDMNFRFNGAQDFALQQGALTLFFNLQHMNNQQFQYPGDNTSGTYAEHGAGLPGVGFNTKQAELNNVAKTLIGQKPSAGSELSYLGHHGSDTSNHFMGILERQFAAASEAEANGPKCMTSGPGGLFIFCPKAIVNHGYTEQFTQIGTDPGKEPPKRLFNSHAGYTGLIYCETGDIQNYATVDRENTLLDFTDGPNTWKYPKIGEVYNGTPSFKHGTLDGISNYSVFPEVAGSKNVSFVCMLTNQAYEAMYDVYDHRIAATAVYEFEDYLKTNLGYDLTDCIFVFVTHPDYSTDRSHLPYTWPDKLGAKWTTPPWSGVADFHPRPMNHLQSDSYGWFVADDTGYEHYLTPNMGYGSTQLMGFNTLGVDGSTFTDYYSFSYNLPVLGMDGVPYSNFDYVYRHNCSPAIIMANTSLWVIERQQPIYHYLIRDLAAPRTGVATTISNLSKVIPILEEEAARFEEMDYESATQDSEEIANKALENCLFDNYTGVSNIQGSVAIENIEEGNINAIQGSIMTISQKAELE
jgi:hypothetical protein